MSKTSEIPSPLIRARAAMREHGVDAVLGASPGLVAFLTGHVLPAYLSYPSRDGRLDKPTLALITQDSAATIGSTPAPEVGLAVPIGEQWRSIDDGPTQFASLVVAADEIGLNAGRLAVELAHVPAGALAALLEARDRLHVEPLGGLLRDAKAIKSDAEVAGILEALALCDAGQDAVRAAAAPGMTELDLYVAAVRGMNSPSDSLVIPLCELQVGPRTALIFGPPTSAVLHEGELVMCDLAPRHPNGWWGDCCMTVACGDVDESVRRDWRDLHDGLEAAREMLRPGVTAGQVHAAAARFVPDLGAHGGHGIGRDHYEEPVISPGSPERLAEGSVIVVEPGRYNDHRGMRIEHAFRVTPDGGERLSRFSLEL